MAFIKAVQHDFYFHDLLWTSNNASVVHSVIAQKATSKNTIIAVMASLKITTDNICAVSTGHQSKIKP